MYVWLDALTNYLTAIGYPPTPLPEGEGKRSWGEGIWPADVHVVGKDILRFHAVFWPAFLMAANLPCPKKIVAHGWWTNEGQKISKSLGNVIDPHTLINEFGLDQTRYFLMREVPFGNDGNFSRDRMITVINSELANTIGNLCQRTLGFINKNCGGVIPESGELLNSDNILLEGSRSRFAKIKDSDTNESKATKDLLNACRYNAAIEGIIADATFANIYIDEQAPWSLKKTDINRMNTVLYTLTEVIRNIAILLQPFMPQSAAKMLVLVGYSEEVAGKGVPFSELDKPLKSGTPLPAPTPVFPRFVEA
jgi:methionyl-tRNA synthetase